MKPTLYPVTALAALLWAVTPAAVQQAPGPTPPAAGAPAAPPATEQEAQKTQDEAPLVRAITMQHFRPLDQRGLNVFEAPKTPGAEFTGVRIDFNAAFTSQVQNLAHRNAAAPNMVNGVNANQLADIGFGFNNSTANLYLHAQLARGIRVQLTSYLSSRHHPETWVKDGYLLIDGSPIDWIPAHALMQFFTVKVGHMEINYGDAHFRRTDNGNAIYNPFVGNYILDAFTTEVGGEIYFRARHVLAMGAVTAGELRGTVLTPGQRGPAFIGKLGYDRTVRPDLRVRVTGSIYTTDKAVSNTLYGGDRAGSRYYYVMENTQAAEASQFTSGLINPGFRNSVQALQINPFVKYRGLEVFGVIERAEGKTTAEAVNRVWTQYAADVVYRFLPGEKMFVGARYNQALGELAGLPGEVGATRWQLGAGWFITPGLLAKLEYVEQKYVGFPAGNIRHGGRFNGLMVEGVVAF